MFSEIIEQYFMIIIFYDMFLTTSYSSNKCDRLWQVFHFKKCENPFYFTIFSK